MINKTFNKTEAAYVRKLKSTMMKLVKKCKSLRGAFNIIDYIKRDLNFPHYMVCILTTTIHDDGTFDIIINIKKTG